MFLFPCSPEPLPVKALFVRPVQTLRSVCKKVFLLTRMVSSNSWFFVLCVSHSVTCVPSGCTHNYIFLRPTVKEMHLQENTLFDLWPSGQGLGGQGRTICCPMPSTLYIMWLMQQQSLKLLHPTVNTPIPHRPRIPRIATNWQVFGFVSESYSVREDLNWFAQSVVSSCNS